MKKYTSGIDADTLADAPEIAPGATVTWTYIVENTGQTNFNASDIKITDDAGTPGVTSDDFSTMGKPSVSFAVKPRRPIA